jgi:hypothetical protein
MGEFFDVPPATLYAAGFLAVLNVPCYILLGKVLFGSWDDFLDAVRFWFTPEILSAFRGEFTDDLWAEFKLWVWATACIGLVGMELFLLTPYLAT